MPWPVYIIALFFGGIVRLVKRALQEEEERRARKERVLEEMEMPTWPRREVNNRPRPARDVGRPAQPKSPVPPKKGTRKKRRFNLVIPLADNQIAMALRPVRAQALTEYPQVTALTFTAEPGGAVVDVMISIKEAEPLDESSLEKIFAQAQEALQRGYLV
ncbi:MAG TPA: hypothetical protein VFC82_10800 [Actinomycetaceae bacterium]|nr:hypothetical protein [Actinomycetaceae bacterium]